MEINFLNSIANSKVVKKFSRWMAESPNFAKDRRITRYDIAQKHLPATTAIVLSIADAVIISKSKETPPERKTPLIINIICSAILGTIANYLFSGVIENYKEKLLKRFDEIVKHENKLGLRNGLKTAIPIVIAGFTFRYLAPVFAVPISDKTTKFLTKKGYITTGKN